ncbi:MAG: putative lipid II flippase FtsW [Clostridia bacterium]|nr:putative lipid II flippase FtsW [Clostridia bacterium]
MTRNKKEDTISLFTKSKEPVDFILLVTVLILLLTGIIMVLSASSPTSLSEYGDSYKYLYKQAFSAGIGLVVMSILAKVDYRFFKRYYKIIYIFCIGLLCLIFLFGSSAKGATRWIDLGIIKFQPSEVAKVGIIIFYAEYLTRKKDKINTFKEGFLKPLLWLIPIIIIVYVFQNHLSATFVICVLAVLLMFMAGTKISYFIKLGVPVIAAGILYIVKKGGFRLTRIFSFFNPWADATDSGWQIIQSLYAIGSGGLFGAGLGNSKQKYLYIPEPHNDFIFAVLAEELGFVGCTLVILLFGVFIWRGIVIAMKSKDMFGGLLAIGITSLIAVEVIINIAVVTASMPVTGMSLPFFSYGGTALIIQLATVGILLNISRTNKKEG